MANIVITQEIPGQVEDAFLQEGHRVRILSSNGPLKKEVLQTKVIGADVIISVLTDKIDGLVMDSAGPQLKIIANYAAGFDNIDLEAAAKRQIIVTNTPKVSSQSVAEHTFALILAVSKQIVDADNFMRTRQYKHWLPTGFLGPELRGKTLGIIGLGEIGRRVAEIGFNGFQMRIIYSDVHKNQEFEYSLKADRHELETILKESDVVSLNVPLLPSTKHLIGRSEIQLMKKTAILINTSRGPVIDESALVTALKNQVIAGAGLDVFEFEPQMEPELNDLENVVLTPHTASATFEARLEMARLVVTNVEAVLHGRAPLNPVGGE